jgi:signal transduction histidine kinase
VDVAGLGSAHSRLEAVAEGAYRAIGWRSILGAEALAFAFGLVCTLLSVAEFTRITGLSGAGSRRLFLLAALVWLATVSVIAVGSLRAMGPVARWASDRDPGHAARAWLVALGAPAVLTKWIALTLLCVGLPLDLLAITTVSDTEPAMVALLVLAVAVVAVLGASIGTFALQLVTRPLLRDLAGELDRAPIVPAESSVRRKLLVAVPAIAICGAVGAVVLTLPVGTAWNDALARALLAVALTLALTGPATFLLAHSTLRPLDDLLEATHRLGRADFSTHVPEISADEYGTLARSMNDAMAGLEEGQRLASANARLLEDVRESRARIVSASDAARRRVERNIHDGAQQRMTALILELRLLEDAAEGAHEPSIAAMARHARESLNLALNEIRELARGLHPAVLVTDGLLPAVEQLVALAPLPVEVDIPQIRFPETLEATAFYVASEGLANVAKHAHASSASVSARVNQTDLVVKVADDGVGGATPGPCSGLAGLADRVAALDGRLEVESPPGGGTLLTVSLPLTETPQDITGSRS